MIYAYSILVLILCISHYLIRPSAGFQIFPQTSSSLQCRPSRTLRLNEVAPWLRGVEPEPENQQQTLTVRFINTPMGKDVVVEDVAAGTNLLFIGDSVGIELPRACRTGLCGSCTCEVQDPSAIKTSTNPREGFATLRACSTKCFVPNGMTEMVVDVQRIRKIKKSSIKRPGDSYGVDGDNSDDISDPMARFSGNWEKDFKPRWELEKMQKNSMSSGSVDVKSNVKACKHCNGVGRIACYLCGGKGRTLMANGQVIQCQLCVGLQTCGCGYCRSTGFLQKAKKD